MNMFDVHVIDKIWEFGPLGDITIRVLHRNHPMQLEEDEYVFTVLVGTTLGEIKQELFAAMFRECRWLHDELMLWEKMCPNVELNGNDDFKDDTTLCLKLINKHYFREESDEEVSEEEVSEEESEEEESQPCRSQAENRRW